MTSMRIRCLLDNMYGRTTWQISNRFPCCLEMERWARYRKHVFTHMISLTSSSPICRTILLHYLIVSQKYVQPWIMMLDNKLPQSMRLNHYSDVIMSTMASQITNLTIVYLTIYSGADRWNIKTPRHWPLWGESTVSNHQPHDCLLNRLFRRR